MAVDIQQDAKLANVFGELKSQIEQLMVLLSQKERFVVERRFSLESDKRFTLEEIGQHFNVTRERVRQIERNALQKLKRNIENFSVIEINNCAYETLKSHGGLLREDILLSKLITDRPAYRIGAIQLLLSLDRRFERLPNTIHYHPYFRFSHFGENLVEQVCEHSLRILKGKKDVESVDKLIEAIHAEIAEARILGADSLRSLFEIHKNFKVMDKGAGLMEWRHIHPRTLRDKIFYILRRNKAPMHFVDIANAIMGADFDKKTLNMQAVHNELIRHGDFVLVGRGLYALKEWGYEHGTVAEVVASVLKSNASMSEEEVIAEVLKRRQVKPITIILNLKNKPQFVRVGRKQYALKKG